MCRSLLPALVLVVYGAVPVVAAEIPRPEHPDPGAERPHWLNLNGSWQFRFDPEKGRLKPRAVPRLRTGEKTGPRHLAFHPSRSLAYVINEQGSSVTTYALDKRPAFLEHSKRYRRCPGTSEGVTRPPRSRCIRRAVSTMVPIGDTTALPWSPLIRREES